jgi:hypothetical protein
MMHFNIEKQNMDYEDLDFIKLLMQLLEYRGIKSTIVQDCQHG